MKPYLGVLMEENERSVEINKIINKRCGFRKKLNTGTENSERNNKTKEDTRKQVKTTQIPGERKLDERRRRYKICKCSKTKMMWLHLKKKTRCFNKKTFVNGNQ